MVNTDIIFDLNKIGPCLPAILVPKHSGKLGIPFGTPCLLDKKRWHYEGAPEANVIFSFPRKRGKATNEIYIAKKRDLIVLDRAPFTEHHKIKMVKKFDWSKVDAIQDYVDEFGSLTIHIANYSVNLGAELVGIAMLEFFNKFKSSLLSKYRYNSIEHFTCDHEYRSKSGTNLAHYITFLSLPNCIPIFNRKKVHGMGMIYNAIKYRESLKNGVLTCAAKLAIILTHHLDNKYVIDGIRVSDLNPVSKDVIKHLNLLAQKHAAIKYVEQEKPKKEEKENPCNWGEGSIKFANVASNTIYFDTSSTTTNYYTTS